MPVVLIGIDFDDDRSSAIAYMRDMGGDWPVVADPGSRTAIGYGVSGVPETFFISRSVRSQPARELEPVESPVRHVADHEVRPEGYGARQTLVDTPVGLPTGTASPTAVGLLSRR